MITGCWLVDSEWIGRFSSLTPMNYSSSWNPQSKKHISRKYQLTSIGWLPKNQIPCFVFSFYHWKQQQKSTRIRKKKEKQNDCQRYLNCLISWCRSRSFGNWSRRLWRGFNYPGVTVTGRLRSRLTGWLWIARVKLEVGEEGSLQTKATFSYPDPKKRPGVFFWGPEFSAYLIQVCSNPKALEGPIKIPRVGYLLLFLLGGDWKNYSIRWGWFHKVLKFQDPVIIQAGFPCFMS